VKYLALVAACLFTVTLAAPATADDPTPDPVEVTFPAVTMFNPEHTPYVLEIHDPAPERGDLVALVYNDMVDLPHEGSATLPFDEASTEYPSVQVFRCPTVDQCAAVTAVHGLRLVTELEMEPDYEADLGAHSRVPVGELTPMLDVGDVVELDWELVATRGGTVITSGSGS
jgi:hypothetical protein